MNLYCYCYNNPVICRLGYNLGGVISAPIGNIGSISSNTSSRNRNALKHVVMIAGKESLLRLTLPAFFIGGIGGGIYGRISEYYNPYGDFIGI